MLRGTVRQALLTLVCAFSSLWAQEFRATLTGRLTDPSGSEVPNATVTAKNVQTNLETTATTGKTVITQSRSYSLGTIRSRRVVRALSESCARISFFRSVATRP